MDSFEFAPKPFGSNNSDDMKRYFEDLGEPNAKSEEEIVASALASSRPLIPTKEQALAEARAIINGLMAENLINDSVPNARQPYREPYNDIGFEGDQA